MRPRALAIALAMGMGPAAARADFTRIVSFGDSLTDRGNVFLATSSQSPPNPTPPPPYADGRFSNGPLWVERLAERLGVSAPTPSLAGGTNFAFGSAMSGAGLSSWGVPNLLTQVAALPPAFALSPTDLVTVWAGANDLIFGGLTDPSPVVDNIATAISGLAARGGRTFVVPNLPRLGDVPLDATATPAQRAGLNALTDGYNALLAARLSSLESGLNVRIVRVDVAGTFQAIRANPSAFGFTNVTDGALPSGVLSGQGYMFWDTIHPTAATHRLIGDAAFAAVPEPASLALTLTAGAAVIGTAAARRRRAA